MKHTVYLVEWGDAFIDTDDFDVEDAKTTEPVYRTSVGFLIAKNQHGYVLATDEYREEKDGVAAKMFIPHGMVIRATKLVPKTKSRRYKACPSSTPPAPSPVETPGETDRALSGQEGGRTRR